MEHTFKLPIGDWSGDGHGKTEDFVIKSNTPIQGVREAYFSACDKIGFTLDGHDAKTPCGEYEESTVPVERFEEMGIHELDTYKEWIEEYKEDGQVEDIDTSEFAQMVLDFIMIHNPEVELNIVPAEEMPTFQWYGHDEKKRHIGFFGYGLFW